MAYSDTHSKTIGYLLWIFGFMGAHRFYYGKPWRLPASLLYGKECYLAVSELKNDFYKEY